MLLAGSPSDEVAAILATGGAGVDWLWVSMSSRDPEGRDLDFLQWHTFDHRPEQFRIPTLRSTLRLVSTPAVPSGPGQSARSGTTRSITS